MSYELWPSTLPRDLLLNGYSGQMGDGRLSTKTDYGPAKIRRRSSFIPDPVSGQMMMTTAQLHTLQAFVKDTLGGGVRPFAMRDPTRALATNVRMLVRLVDLPSWSAITPELFTVSLKLEKLDLIPAIEPSFAPGAFAAAREGVPYTQTVTVLEGRLPLQSITLASGSLPVGLVVANDGTISGTPTDFGTSAFTLRVTDGDGRTADGSKSIVVRPPGWIRWSDGSIIDPTVSRPTIASYWSKTGELAVSPIDAPRFEYGPTGQFTGVLIEPASSNLVWPSNDLSNPRWTKAASTVSASGDTLTPWSIVSNGSNFARAQQSVAAQAGTATFSVILKAGTTNFYHATIEAGPARYYGNLTTGQTTQTNNASTIGHRLTSLGGGYWLAEFVVNLASAASTPVFVGPASSLGSTQATNGQTIMAGHLQFEQSVRGSSRIQTTTSGLTRSADTISFILPTIRNRLVYTFDDGSTQTIENVGQTHTIPLSLARRHIRKIDGSAM